MADLTEARTGARLRIGEPRSVCPRCRRPVGVCFCGLVTALSTRTRVVVLQHPRERDVPVNTARIASLCLPAADVHVGIRFDPRVFSDSYRPAVLLYPGPGAIDVEQYPPPTDITLVVVDGTWSQTKKLIQLNPELAALPRYAFRPEVPSAYRIRRQPRADCVSTLEALMHVLGAIEGNRERFLSMMRPFRAMVDAQIAFAEGNLRRPRLRFPRVRSSADPMSRLPAVLRERSTDLVCVHAEANAWPYGAVERSTAPEELVQWVAHRPTTGETFEAIVAPRHALCPKTPWHVGISADDLHHGMTTAELVERWRDFARAEDVVCTWGGHSLRVFAAAGGPLPKTCVDLRQASRVYSSVPVGTMDSFRVRLGLDPVPLRGAGRAAARLATLTTIASFFAGRSECPARRC